MQKKQSRLLQDVKTDMLKKRDKIRSFMKENSKKHATHSKFTLKGLSGTKISSVSVKRPHRKSMDLTRKYTALRQDITPSRIFEQSEKSLPQR